jgi:glycerophosphoryl diester phosphodiesterase
MPLDWLTARPIAHRGLHNAVAGVIENTPSALSAAIAAGYAIEIDAQITVDGEAVMHHDFELGRLTDGHGALARMTAAELARVPFKATGDRIITLAQVCELVAGHVPLLIEIKSRFDGDLRLTQRVAQVLTDYPGPAAAMSFDPEVVACLREAAPALARGIVAERWYRQREWAILSMWQRQSLGNLLHGFRTRPQFVAYAVRDLPATAPLVARQAFGLPLLTWTVRSDADRARARRWADQIIFEGFRP